MYAIDGEQQAVEAQGNSVTDNAIQQPDGHAQHDHAEEPFDLFHPHAGTGQQAAAAGAEDDQGQAHADGQGKQGGGTGGRITAGGYVDQGAGQDRGNARGNHQG